MTGYRTAHGGPVRNVMASDPLDQEMEKIEQEIEFPVNSIVSGDIESLISVVIDGGLSFLAQQEEHFLKTIAQIISVSGGEISANGRPLTPDLFIDAIEAVELSLDDDLRLNLPTMLLNPETRMILESQPFTDEHQRRLNSVLFQKWTILLANRKVRVFEDKS